MCIKSKTFITVFIIVLSQYSISGMILRRFNNQTNEEMVAISFNNGSVRSEVSVNCTEINASEPREQYIHFKNSSLRVNKSALHRNRSGEIQFLVSAEYGTSPSRNNIRKQSGIHLTTPASAIESTPKEVTSNNKRMFKPHRRIVDSDSNIHVSYTKNSTKATPMGFSVDLNNYDHCNSSFNMLSLPRTFSRHAENVKNDSLLSENRRYSLNSHMSSNFSSNNINVTPSVDLPEITSDFNKLSKMNGNMSIEYERRSLNSKLKNLSRETYAKTTSIPLVKRNTGNKNATSKFRTRSPYDRVRKDKGIFINNKVRKGIASTTENSFSKKTLKMNSNSLEHHSDVPLNDDATLRRPRARSNSFEDSFETSLQNSKDILRQWLESSIIDLSHEHENPDSADEEWVHHYEEAWLGDYEQDLIEKLFDLDWIVDYDSSSEYDGSEENTLFACVDSGIWDQVITFGHYTYKGCEFSSHIEREETFRWRRFIIKAASRCQKGTRRVKRVCRKVWTN